MSPPRFFCSPLPNRGTITLDESEARHASQVLRLRPGDRVSVFDGSGGEASGQIATVSRRTVTVDLLERSDRDRELKNSLRMWIALPKGDRQRILVDGLVQLGVDSVTPLICERGVAQPGATGLEKLRRAVIESSKQCGRNRLMTIHAGQALQEPFPTGEAVLGLRLFAHPYPPAQPLAAICDADIPPSADVAIGPEGGFTPREVQWLASAGWLPVALGPRILRIEMAALLVAAWWASRQSNAT